MAPNRIIFILFIPPVRCTKVFDTWYVMQGALGACRVTLSIVALGSRNTWIYFGVMLIQKWLQFLNILAYEFPSIKILIYLFILYEHWDKNLLPVINCWLLPIWLLLLINQLLWWLFITAPNYDYWNAYNFQMSKWDFSMYKQLCHS